MSDQKGSKMKRFFVQAPETAQKQLQHLAIDLDTSAEKLAGAVLADFAERSKKDPELARKVLRGDKR